jgi:hypothetical protein
VANVLGTTVGDTRKAKASSEAADAVAGSSLRTADNHEAAGASDRVGEQVQKQYKSTGKGGMISYYRTGRTRLYIKSILYDFNHVNRILRST